MSEIAFARFWVKFSGSEESFLPSFQFSNTSLTPPTSVDEYYGLDYGQVTAILWKICQHQQKEIDELKDEINKGR